MDTTQKKLAELRKVMKSQKIDAVIIPSNDPHQSEYVSPHWQERAWISGFTGSAGLVIVTHDHAGLWTDSRYFIQAEMELANSGFTLHKMYNQFGSPHIEYLLETLPAGSSVAVNGFMFSKQSIDGLQNALSKKKIGLVYQKDLISMIWKDRPENSLSPIFIHSETFTGQSINEKLRVIRNKIKMAGGDALFLSTLDDIAWSFNIRGNDVEYNPVAIAYAVIDKTSAHLFIDARKVTRDVKGYFTKAKVKLHPYEELLQFLSSMGSDQTLLVDESTISQSVYDAIQCKVKYHPSIPKWEKAIKTNVEIQHLRNTMRKDGAALAHTFHWIEKSLKQKKSINECDVADKLAEYRSQQEHYFGESFAAIVGYQSNGAIVHYHAHRDTCKTILPKGILLVDSGGQYFDGTTDITRTFTLSKPKKKHKISYTSILKGMICVARTKFPKGTTGIQLDTLARQFLWSHGLNYLHGTGHGVGYFLNVHEPPQGIAPSFAERGKTVHEVGMLTSDEPGYYEDGAYGMRIENLIVAKASEYKGFLEFETLTLYPFEKKLIDKKLLSCDEKHWINAYHDECYQRISPYLKGEVKSWFKKKCKKI
ncbi:MAG: aminopeptidase P family protein [Saprospiraceae bacterium]|nr:aminopeptidase P family protein [Saprospiraceae bacterium]MCB9310521.1 aminopeptidase P family protein [Lewinellaceae bacterium]